MFKKLGAYSALATAISVAFSSSALAAGFQVNEHSANGFGRAMAGQAAKPENASILATNPAAITQFSKAQLSAQLSYINPELDVEGQVVTQAAGMTFTNPASEEDVADSALVPAAFYVAPLNDKVSWGIGMFSNYGLSTDYSDSFNALNFADYAEVMSVTVNPTIAYKVSDTLSVGVGISATYSEAEISTSVPALMGALSQGAIPANASILALEGDDWGFGYNLGLFWQPVEGTNIGLSYRAETQLTLDGKVSSDLVQSLNQAGSLDLNLAAITEIALDQVINAQWSIQASAVHTDWSTFEKLEANLADGTDLLIKQENFDNSWRGSLGATYLYSDEITLRAGVAYDDGVVSRENRSLSIPDTDRTWYTVGATYTLDDNSSIDVAYGYITGREAIVDKQNVMGSAATGAIVSNLTATETANAHVLSVQYNLAF